MLEQTGLRMSDIVPVFEESKPQETQDQRYTIYQVENPEKETLEIKNVEANPVKVDEIKQKMREEKSKEKIPALAQENVPVAVPSPQDVISIIDSEPVPENTSSEDLDPEPAPK